MRQRDIERLNISFFLICFPSSFGIFFTFPPDPFVPQLFQKTVLFRQKLLDEDKMIPLRSTCGSDTWGHEKETFCVHGLFLKRDF